MTIIEVAISVTILALFGTSAVHALLNLNRDATTTRVISAAREVAQRNMEVAMTAPFTTGSIPPILAVNNGTGWNETNDVSLGSSPVNLLAHRDGSAIATATIRRTVTLLGGTLYNPATRRVTFTISYSLHGRVKPDYILTSIRSPDS